MLVPNKLLHKAVFEHSRIERFVRSGRHRRTAPLARSVSRARGDAKGLATGRLRRQNVRSENPLTTFFVQAICLTVGEFDESAVHVRRRLRPLRPAGTACSRSGGRRCGSAGRLSTGDAAGGRFGGIPRGRQWWQVTSGPAGARATTTVDRRREQEVIRDFFAGTSARERASRLLAIAGSWGPDVIVHDEMDFGAAIAAEKLGVPHVAIVVLAAGGLIRTDLLSRTLNTVRAEFGLPTDPDLSMLHRNLTLVPAPRRFRHPDDPLPPTAHHIQPAVLSGARETADPDAATISTLEWLGRRKGRPTVYFTLGTVFHQESGDLFTRVMTALGQLDANVVITVGNEIDPAELGVRADSIHIERFIPQQVLLAHCQVAVTHAGSGSVIGALAFGVPLVLLPMGADQPWNADRCQELGVAEVLDPIAASAAQIREATNTVLGSDSHRRAARSMREEIIALPDADHGMSLIRAVAQRANRTGT